MAKHYNTAQALAVIMEPDPEPMDHESVASVTPESDKDTAEEDEEYFPGAGSSDTGSSDSPDTGEADTPAGKL
ncbi:hypothetical protein GBF38_003677 [Nibea albiflora]|uniref:Uncharacterized protein n=1 Tax=Nibea albiflora TaxID=240163 RepID=A0ACB7FG77_NIBAL|nr:hypothetical protein GBF38_003677 [Nibea albiflora]